MNTGVNPYYGLKLLFRAQDASKSICCNKDLPLDLFFGESKKSVSQKTACSRQQVPKGMSLPD